MARAIADTSVLLYLYRVESLNFLNLLFEEVWVPNTVFTELEEGRRGGHDVPDPSNYSWIRQVEPQVLPPEWLVLDLGPGELSVMALALENPTYVVLLDDALARRIATAARLTVWGMLRVLLEAKEEGHLERMAPLIDRLMTVGMWLSEDLRQRILVLAGETGA